MIAGLLLGQEAPGIPFDGKVLATATGLLAFFALLMYRSMGRAEKRVDTAAETVVAAAAAERDRALSAEQRVQELWQQEREKVAALRAQLDVRDRRIAQMETEVRMLQRMLPSPAPPPRVPPREPPNGPSRR